MDGQVFQLAEDDETEQDPDDRYTHADEQQRAAVVASDLDQPQVGQDQVGFTARPVLALGRGGRFLRHEHSRARQRGHQRHQQRNHGARPSQPLQTR